jgi:hypothetical protein
MMRIKQKTLEIKRKILKEGFLLVFCEMNHITRLVPFLFVLRSLYVIVDGDSLALL